MKYLLFILILLSSVFADIHFKETRYISALDIDRQMSGILRFDDNSMVINYTKPNKEEIQYFEDKVIMINQNGTKEYLFSKYPQASYMGLILKSILTNNYDPLENFFTIITKDNITTFSSKSSASTISSIDISKDKQNNLVSMMINMTNKDTISIEIVQ